jgi:TRAP-type mannitol/chloroaromatic compound transport system permease small subunit
MNWRGWLKAFDRCMEVSAKGASFVILLVMGTVTFEVVSRYLFNQPTIWVWPINRILFGIFILIAGSYAMLKGAHIRIEILYDRFPDWMRNVSKLVTLLAIICFLGVLIWQSAWMGWTAVEAGEKLPGAFRIPIYPFKVFVPLASILFLIVAVRTVLSSKD